jgi:hypothetical protein
VSPGARRALAAPKLEDVVAALGPVCRELPGAYEEPAWVGTRWRVGRHTFAHVLAIADGRPNAYALAAGSRGPLTVLTVRTSEPERYQGGRARRPFFWPGWFPDLLGRVLETPVDLEALAPLLLESYCVVAPKRLVRQLIVGDCLAQKS